MNFDQWKLDLVDRAELYATTTKSAQTILEEQRGRFLKALGGKWASYQPLFTGIWHRNVRIPLTYFLPDVGRGVYMYVAAQLPRLDRDDLEFNKIAQFVIDTQRDVWLCGPLDHVPDNVIFYTDKHSDRIQYWKQQLKVSPPDPEAKEQLDLAIRDGNRWDYDINDALPQPNGTFSYGLNPYNPEWGYNRFWDQALIAAQQ